MHKSIFILNIGIFFLLILILVYFITQSENLMKLIPQKNEEQQVKPTSPQKQKREASPAPHIITREETEAAIIKYTNSTDRTNLESYMVNKVPFILYATDCCQLMTPKEVVIQMDYINEGMPFTFDQKNPTILNLKAKNPQFSDTFIGISQTQQQAAIFTINTKTNLIESIQLSVSWKLYNQK